MQRIRSGNEKIHPSRSADAAIGLYTETSYGPKSPHVLIAAGLWKHESGTYVKLTQSGADLFA